MKNIYKLKKLFDESKHLTQNYNIMRMNNEYDYYKFI
jgi:hypothetical protein